jgi:hypothetical protein
MTQERHVSRASETNDVRKYIFRHFGFKIKTLPPVPRGGGGAQLGILYQETIKKLLIRVHDSKLLSNAVTCYHYDYC